MLLVVTARRVELRVVGGDKQLRGGRPLHVDAAALDTTSPAGRRLKQPIAKAVGLRRLKDLRASPPALIDTTAGWGADTFLLASLGCRVLTVERHKVVHTLLRDGLMRAAAQRPGAFGRIWLLHTDARAMLRRMGGSNTLSDADLPDWTAPFFEPDVVYLDPMFPPRRGKGAESKAMRVLRRLVGDDADAEATFHAARRVAKRRVVVKRPLRAEPLEGIEPTTTHKGKSMRYDVYVLQ